VRVPIEVRVSGAGVEFGLSTNYKYFGAGERGMLILPLGAELAVECV
jgi:hypothetical protein